MAYPKKSPDEPPKRRSPARDPETREIELVAAAMDLAEKQIHEGVASATVITHYLKIGSQRDRLERERLRTENELLQRKIEQMESAKRVENLYEEAIKAFRMYSGQEDEEVGDDDF